MKKNTMIKLAAGVAAILLVSTSANAGYTMKKKVGGVDTKLTVFGFAQLEARGGSGVIADNEDSKVAFGAQRIRLGWKYVAGNVRGKVFLDFNQNHDDNKKTGDGAAMPSMVKDAFISYVVDPAFVVKAGLIKMPNGMSFTMPGWNLDIAERGFDKKLVLERNTGLMISGRDIGLGNNGKVNGFEMGHERPWKGFGYDVMIANQASRSASASSSKNGGNSYAVRGMFDYTEKLHIEASYALSENAKGPSGTTGGEDYKNINIGVDSNLGKLSLKAEFFDAKNIKGTKDRDEQVFTATAGYFVTPSLEVVAKHMQGNATWATGTPDTTLSNTYLGLNIFMSMPYEDFSRKAKRARNQHKVVLNYIVAGGDTTKWNGLGGYNDNAFIAQYQFKF
ncbi:porin [Sulfurimonas sp.]|uniref:porin n=1 Tax=Sulfurimonas sp. TaxID=2022749 RepID=UPI002B49829D|nr:porin [Sulfurimonas sp.]